MFDRNELDRRRFLELVGTPSLLALAGCTDGEEDEEEEGAEDEENATGEETEDPLDEEDDEGGGY